MLVRIYGDLCGETIYMNTLSSGKDRLRKLIRKSGTINIRLRKHNSKLNAAKAASRMAGIWPVIGPPEALCVQENDTWSHSRYNGGNDPILLLLAGI